MQRLGILLLFLSSISLGYDFCPKWTGSPDLPECPDGPILSENYPTAFVVVSDSSQVGRSGERASDAKFTADVVLKALEAGGDNPPKIVVTTIKKSTLDEVQRRIKDLKMSPEKTKLWLNHVVVSGTESFTWQQDFYQNFLNEKTGKPILRPFVSYMIDEVRGDIATSIFTQLSSDLESCGVTRGKVVPLSSLRKKAEGGQMGGNIEALPGGICVLGSDGFKDSEWEKHATEICGKNDDNKLKAPTSFLLVGHTDEIFKVIQNPSKPEPCNFSIAIASPQKAVELLRQNEKQEFFQTKNKSVLRTSETFFELCTRYNKLIESKGSGTTRSRSQSLNWIFSPAFAQSYGQIPYEIDDEDMPQSMEEYNSWLEKLKSFSEKKKRKLSDAQYKSCEDMSNADYLWFMQSDREVKNYVTEVQDEMNKFKDDIKAKLKRKLPQCETDIIDVPNLFWGGESWKEKSKNTLPAGFGHSIQPAPTNSITIGNTNIIPDPYNESFKKYVREEYAKRGVKTEFVDTWNYAHRGFGNLHCSTQTFHVCKPRSSK